MYEVGTSLTAPHLQEYFLEIPFIQNGEQNEGMDR